MWEEVSICDAKIILENNIHGMFGNCIIGLDYKYIKWGISEKCLRVPMRCVDKKWFHKKCL